MGDKDFILVNIPYLKQKVLIRVENIIELGIAEMPTGKVEARIIIRISGTEDKYDITVEEYDRLVSVLTGLSQAEKTQKIIDAIKSRMEEKTK